MTLIVILLSVEFSEEIEYDSAGGIEPVTLITEDINIALGGVLSKFLHFLASVLTVSADGLKSWIVVRRKWTGRQLGRVIAAVTHPHR